MAEGGGMEPRSNEGTPAYKAGPSDQLDTLRSFDIEGAPRLDSRPGQGCCGSSLRVMALCTALAVVHSAIYVSSLASCFTSTALASGYQLKNSYTEFTIDTRQELEEDSLVPLPVLSSGFKRG